MKNLINDPNGQQSSVRFIGLASFALLVLAAFVDMTLAIVFVTERNIPDIIYITFSGIVGASLLGASFQHLTRK